ncbi:mitochondrial PGP phosphatase-domain-containing protein [Endogone sp. FLAS-F59071]|nr:mitochondrial PGP phosphatase-domain-containing protein [Endogone sp. FLAS-F59071]|eukprot:RUS17695.1 mitochondrial PGP phosphatase-domain-containing protein [Endogone sp. FLAS-F59071]
MVQSFNLSAIISAFRLIVQPSLAVPHLVVTDIRHINFSSLKSSGFRALAFDKDNCLTAPYQSKVYSPFQGAWDDCKAIFGAENIVIVSNSAGTRDDVGGKQKPSGGAALLTYFRAHPPDTLVVIGDRLLTDIVYGNSVGAFTVLTRQVVSEKGDNPAAMVIRRWEHRLLDRFTQLRITPPPHPSDNQLDKSTLVKAA